MAPSVRRVLSLAVVALLGFSLAACGGSGRFRYPNAETPLALDRVVLYRNGIGYFERVGKIDGDMLTVKVRKDQVDDLLKSLTIVERKSGRAVSVSMPLDPQTWANAALATLRPGQGSLAEVLDALRGTQVTLSTTIGTLSGRIVMVEKLVEPADDDDEGPKNDHRVTLLDGARMHIVKLSQVRGVELEDGDLAMQFNRTLDASAGEGMFQQVAVSIRLAGASTHDLLVSYVVAAPMWKPTYRVVLPKEPKGKALLQAWAVVDNTSGEEWHKVQIALTSGAPIAFRYDLHTPRNVARQDLTQSSVNRQADAMIGETTYEAPPPPPMAAPAEPMDVEDETMEYDKAAEATTDGKNKKKDATRRAPARAAAAPSPMTTTPFQSGMGGAARGPADDRPTVDYDALRRSTLAQAQAKSVAGQTRFEIGERVTVPEGTSTMVAIVNADVEGEEAFLFRPGGAGSGYQTNPYRVVRFRNSTPFVLEPGPISIYAEGSFVGEGLSETVGAGTSATIPFAVETGIMVTSQIADNQDDMHLVKLSRGVLEVEQFARRVTKYTAKAQTMDDGYTVLVRHAKTGWNYELANRPAGTEDLPDAYLVRLVVPKGAREGGIELVEQTPSRSSLSIWTAPALVLLEKLLVDTNLGGDAKKKLKPIVDMRRELGKLDEQFVGLTARRDKLDQRANELRENLRAIAKNTKAGEQRAKWTKQLEEFTTEGNKLGADLASLEAKRMDKRIELEDAVGELEINAPAAKK